MAEEDPRLPAGAEALLQGLPLPEPDFEALASRVDARIATTVPGSTDDALLAAPFPDEAGEELPAPAQPAAPRLSDLARAVAQKRTDAADTELAREALSAASKLRSQTDVLVERMRAAPKAAEPPLRPAATETAPARPLPPPPRLPRSEASAASVPPPAQTQKEKKGSLTALWGGAGLVLAAAAAWLVLLGSPQKPEASRADTAVDAAPAASAVAQAEAPKDVEHPLPPVAVAEPTPAPAAEPAAAEPVAIGKGRASRGVDNEGSSAASSPVVARPKKSSAPPAHEKAELAAAPAKPAAQAPAGPSNQDAQLKPAAGNAGDELMPDKPSTGAVQAAIASVMGSARTCVAGADGATPATVIFGSNGSVKSVVVGGAVEGTPAGKCISSALSRAKVAPFAQSSFSVGVSVRP